METLHLDHKFVENQKQSSFWDFKSKYEFVDEWFLMGSPYPLLVLTSAYLLFILKLGPDYLKNRKPFDLKNALLIYNLFQVGLSLWMFMSCFREMLIVGPIQRTCLTENDEQKKKVATLTYYYFFCKITELVDTIFFVLRKKQNQVSFLHVYHHTMMVWNSWVFLKYEPGYWMLFLGSINSFVHVVMYSYYLLSAYPSLQKYLWWKKYITSMQLIQFGLLLVQMTINISVNECRVSIQTIVYFYFNAMFFIYLFSDFYIQSYKDVDSNKVKNDASNGKSKLNKKEIHKNNIKHRNGKKNDNGFTNVVKSNEDEDYINHSRTNTIYSK